MAKAASGSRGGAIKPRDGEAERYAPGISSGEAVDVKPAPWMEDNENPGWFGMDPSGSFGGEDKDDDDGG
jgi:hypothetical protein